MGDGLGVFIGIRRTIAKREQAATAIAQADVAVAVGPVSQQHKRGNLDDEQQTRHCAPQTATRSSLLRNHNYYKDRRTTLPRYGYSARRTRLGDWRVGAFSGA
jgi:hypothetical protein